MKQPIRFSGRALVIELPEISGKKNLEQWAEGVAQQLLEDSDGTSEYVVSYLASVALTAFMNALKDRIEDDMEKYVGDSIHGIQIGKGAATSSRYNYAHCLQHTELEAAKKDLEATLKLMLKKKNTPSMEQQEIVQWWLNPLTGEQVTLTEEDLPEENVSKKFPFTLKL